MEKKVSVKESWNKAVRIAVLLVGDALIVGFAAFFALWVRLDFSVETISGYGYWPMLRQFALVGTPLTIGMLAVLNLYNSLWIFASVEELARIVGAGILAALAEMMAIYAGVLDLPRSFPLLYGMFFVAFLAASRFSYRAARVLLRYLTRRPLTHKNTMLIGAGEAGIMTLRELQTSERSENRVVCIIDDDPAKQGRRLRGVRIVGGRDEIVKAAQKHQVEEIVVALPSASPRERRAIMELCQKTGCKLKTLPGLIQLANNEVSVQKIRDVDVLDLLGRESIQVDLSQIAGYLHDKTVLVTGGGGSIGSELCRQIAKNHPKRLVIFDIYENNAYAIQQELRRSVPDLDLEVRIGSVRDAERVNLLFGEFKPEIVFHAAAHKHVPLMEDSPNEAIKNNVFGTLNVAEAAHNFGTETFVLISTDKAVNPTNIMGASKRLCEMIVQTMANHADTKFVAVRFGNVLGSNGSVIPLFKKQIAEGGPVTVTHRDIIRYFMTIPEAVSLVLQAGSYAQNGEIFVLDMGEPVRIDDLARNMIRLSGFEPDVDIDVVYTGLRPGEKLYEELLMKEEGMRSTPNQLIYIGQPLDIDEAEFIAQLEQLEGACKNNSPEIRAMVKKMVPTYRPQK